MLRVVISISSNIAEGYARELKIYFHQFLRVAYGSSAELETQIMIAKELEYIKEKEYDSVLGFLQKVMKMIHAILAKGKE